MNMGKVDARKQTRDALFERRRQVVQLLGEGVPVMKIVECTGLSWAAVNAAIEKYRLEGDSGLRPAARGRKPGAGRALTEDQEADVRQFIRRRRPQYYKLKKNLWDRDTVKQLIELKCGIALTDRAIGNYLSRWGLVSKSSKRRESDRCSQAVRKWLDLGYAEIRQQALEEGAKIYWLRESVMINAAAWYSPNKNQDPISEASAPAAPKKKLSMISVATNQGKVLWAISNGPFDPGRQIKFVESLIRNSKGRMIVLIRRDFKAYSSEHFKWWVRANDQRVKVFPKYQLSI